MKRGMLAIILILIASILLFSACSGAVLRRADDADEDTEERTENEEEEEEEEEEEPSATPDPDEDNGGRTEEPPTPEPSGDDLGIRPISFSEAGLEPLPYVDLDQAGVHPRIIELIEEPWDWEMEDYTLGIDQYNYIFIIRSRFPDNIVGDIVMGSSFSDIIDELGDPGYQQDGLLAYRTRDYYLTFYGDGQADLVSFMAASKKDYDDDFLYDLIAELNSDSFTSLEESIKKLDPDMDFFYEKGSNDGVTYYAHSPYGVNVSDEVEPIIDIMNNYEGNLYIKDSGYIRYSQAFINIDSSVLLQRNILYRSDNIDRTLDEYGVYSPDGLLKAVYFGEENCFIVRTLDASIQDRFMYEFTNGEFFWLGSRYLLFISDFGDRPEFLDVDDSMPWGESLLEQVGLDESGTFEIKLVDDQVITLENTDNGEIIEIEYELDGSGEISFSAR